METLASLQTGESNSLETKIEALRKVFFEAAHAEEKYRLLIEFGKSLPFFDPQFRTEEYLVRGCQSNLYLFAEKRDQKIFFFADGDALISKGLAALLIDIYSGETIETILTRPPLFLSELGIYASLTPGRSNGLHHIYLKMKQLSVKCIAAKGKVE